MLSFIKHILVLLLFPICFGVFLLYAILAFNQGIDVNAFIARPETIPVPMIIAAIALVASPFILAFLISPLFRLTSSRGFFESFLRTLLALAIIAFIGYQLIDARKVYQPFKPKDLVITSPDAGKAEFLLGSVFQGTLGPIPTVMPLSNATYYRQIGTYQETIDTAWKRLSPYRVVIEQLSELSALPQPAATTSSPGNGPQPLNRLLDIAGCYYAQSGLDFATGDRAAGMRSLTTMLRVARMGFIGAINLDEKLAWATVLQDGIRLGYWFVVRQAASYDEIKELASTTPHLTGAEASLQETWVAAYLNASNRLTAPADQVIAGYDRAHPDAIPTLRLLPPKLMDACYRFTFQKNRTASMLRSFWQPIIESAGNDPAAFRSAWQRNSNWLSVPPLRNLSGWYYHAPADHSTDEKRVTDLVTMNMLYEAFLKSRMDIAGDIAAHLNGAGPVIVREQQIIAIGADRHPNTDDDVVLAPLW